MVRINEEVHQVKPGMTAVVEIHVEHLQDVLCVPVQAIVQRGDETWCYVSKDGQVQKCLVTAGKTNDKFVEVCAGLQEGDQVVLNPSAILGEESASPQNPGPDRIRRRNHPSDAPARALVSESPSRCRAGNWSSSRRELRMLRECDSTLGRLTLARWRLLASSVDRLCCEWLSAGARFGRIG